MQRMFSLKFGVNNKLGVSPTFYQKKSLSAVMFLDSSKHFVGSLMLPDASSGKAKRREVGESVSLAVLHRDVQPILEETAEN